MNRPFVALLLALFAGGVAAAPIRVLLPAYVEAVLGQSPTLTAALLAIQLGCGGLFALAGGAVSDLLSRRAAVLIGLTPAIFGASLFLAREAWLLVALAVLWGIASGFHSTGGQSFLMASVSRARLGSATAVYFISGTASTAVGAFFGGHLADRLGFAAVTASAAALALLSLGLAVVFLPPLGRDDGDAGSRTVQRHGWSLAGYGDLLRRGDVLALGALRYFPTVAWGAASLAIPLLVFRLSGNTSTVGLYSMISLLAASAAQLAVGREVDRRARTGRGWAGSPRRLVVPLTATILLCAAGAALFSGHLLGLFVAGTAWAMSAWGLSTTMPPIIHELGEGRDDGRLVAFTHLLWSAGMLSGTLGAGAVVDLHPSGPFVLAVACLFVTVVVGMRFSRRYDSSSAAASSAARSA